MPLHPTLSVLRNSDLPLLAETLSGDILEGERGGRPARRVIGNAANAPESGSLTKNMKETFMKANEGTIDRGIRILLGVVLISLVYIGPKTPWGWIGLLPLATGIIGFCGLYALLGINTCPMKRRDS